MHTTTLLPGGIAGLRTESFGRVRIQRPVAQSQAKAQPTAAPLRVESTPARSELDALARRSAAANGFGDAIVAPVALRSDPLSIQLNLAARRRRSRLWQQLVEKAADASRDLIGRWIADWRRRRMSRDTVFALRGLEARTLRDIGLDPSEIRSVAAELSGAAEATRARVLAAHPMRAA